MRATRLAALVASVCLAPGFTMTASGAPLRDGVQKIALGSCNDQSKPQTHWEHIRQLEPQLWIWLGDSIYADDATPEERWQEYSRLLRNESYSDFADSGVKITGIWDDHDYGSNGSGVDYEHKQESKERLLQFLGVAPEEEVFGRDGIYRSYDFGPEDRLTRLVLLDTRSFKESPGRSSELLGEAQWLWLEDTLADSEVDLFIIASGISISSAVRFGSSLEGWSQYRNDRNRLRALLDQVPQSILLLSGDRHSADFATFKLDSGRQVVEFMSSGLTHTYPAFPHHRRIGRPYTKTNFGLIEIEWEGETPIIDLSIHSAENGSLKREIRVP